MKKIGDVWKEPSKSAVVNGYKIKCKEPKNACIYITGLKDDQLDTLKQMYNPKMFKWKKVKIQEIK